MDLFFRSVMVRMTIQMTKRDITKTLVALVLKNDESAKHFIERRILHIISCHVSKGTQHCGWCSNSTLPLPALSLFRGVQQTGWPALICPTMCNDHFKAMEILTHNFAREYKACNKQGGPLLLYVQPEHFHFQNSDNSPMRLNMYATRETQLSRR